MELKEGEKASTFHSELKNHITVILFKNLYLIEGGFYSLKNKNLVSKYGLS